MRGSRLIAIALAVAPAACGFHVAAVLDGAGGDDAPSGDGPGDGPAALCPWPYSSMYVDPCAGTPGEPLDELVLATGKHELSSETGMLVDVVTNGTRQLVTTMVDGVRVVWTQRLQIDAGAGLRISGAFPLVLVSTSSITIDGFVDASSHHAAGAYSVGPGANPTVCPADLPEPGKTCSHGGSGGGGGGFGSVGGEGGRGAASRDCSGQVPNTAASTGVAGGLGGVAAASSTALRGGCGGRGGGYGDGDASDAGMGGPGGGALGLVARTDLVVGATGVVHAGGAGGRGGGGSRAGAGGGGTGGMIYVAGGTVQIMAGGVLAANGGGGGGGGDGPGQPGTDGRPSADVAPGGLRGNAGSPGGEGGYMTTIPTGGGTGDRGGSGGGGGVGVIRIQAGTTTSIAGAVISPPTM